MADIHALYDLWLKKADKDPDLRDELLSIQGDEEAINDRFWTTLAFGTGGLRGVIGAGTNRMNVYTVSQATQGLADYLNVDRSALSNELSKMQRDGLIQVEKNRFTLVREPSDLTTHPF